MTSHAMCAGALIGGLLVACGWAESPPASAPTSTSRPASRPASQPAFSGVHAFTVEDIDEIPRSLGEYRGKVLLIVNVASRCGFTPQYVGLEKLYREYKARGLVVLGVPSNDFGRQEPGSNAEIKEFCSTRFHTTFPMLAKVSVAKGPQQIPLYRYLTSKRENGVLDATVSWNFNKFLVGKDGHLIRHFGSKTTPDDKELRRLIETALAR